MFICWSDYRLTVKLIKNVLQSLGVIFTFKQNQCSYLKQSRSKDIDDVIITLCTKVTISSLSITQKIYLNLFEKFFRLKKVSKTDWKSLKSKHFEDVIIMFYPRVTIGSLPNWWKMFFNLLELYFYLRKMHENNSKQ